MIFSIVILMDYFERTALGASFDYQALYVLGVFGVLTVIILLLMAAGSRRGKAHLGALGKGDYTAYICPYERKMWSLVRSASRRGGGAWYYYYIEIGGKAVSMNIKSSEYESMPIPGEIKVVVLDTGKEKRFIFIPNSVYMEITK